MKKIPSGSSGGRMMPARFSSSAMYQPSLTCGWLGWSEKSSGDSHPARLYSCRISKISSRGLSRAILFLCSSRCCSRSWSVGHMSVLDPVLQVRQAPGEPRAVLHVDPVLSVLYAEHGQHVVRGEAVVFPQQDAVDVDSLPVAAVPVDEDYLALLLLLRHQSSSSSGSMSEPTWKFSYS